jgi:hypothetical protein
MYWDAVCAITAKQQGLVTTEQVLALGATHAWLDWAVRDGRLRRVRRGVYAMYGGPTPEYQPLMSACLSIGTRAAASDLAAGWLWGAPDVAPGALVVTVFGACSARLPGVTVRRTSLDPSGLVVTRHGVPTVVPPLVVVQLAALGHRILAERVANDFVKRGLTSFSAISGCLEAAGGRGRKGAAELRALCDREAEIKGHDDSAPARALGRALKRAGVPPFVTQHEVVIGRHVMHLDFAWPEHLVGLEYQGWADHGTRHGFDSDAARRGRLTAAGWRILDATSGIAQPEIVRWVLATLRQPTSSRLRGRSPA